MLSPQLILIFMAQGPQTASALDEARNKEMIADVCLRLQQEAGVQTLLSDQWPEAESILKTLYPDMVVLVDTTPAEQGTMGLGDLKFRANDEPSGLTAVLTNYRNVFAELRQADETGSYHRPTLLVWRLKASPETGLPPSLPAVEDDRTKDLPASDPNTTAVLATLPVGTPGPTGIDARPSVLRVIHPLIEGADDVLEGLEDSLEIAVRLLAHLRRQIDHLQGGNPTLPLGGLLKQMQRLLYGDTSWMLSVMRIRSLDIYAKEHGESATKRLIRETFRLIQKAIRPPDMIAQIGPGTFCVLCQEERVEKLFEHLAEQFTNEVLPTALLPQELARTGFLYSPHHHMALMSPSLCLKLVAIPLKNASTTPLEKESTKSSPFFEAFHYLTQTSRLMSHIWMHPVQHWLIDRVLLEGEAVELTPTHHQTAWLFALPTPMDMLFESSLVLEGWQVHMWKTPPESSTWLKEAISQTTPPSLIVISLRNPETPTRYWPEEIFQHFKTAFPDTAVVVLSDYDDKAHALKLGADAYLQTPFDLVAFLEWLRRLYPTQTTANQDLTAGWHA
jgi:CheY-like chemotaxis protein